MFNKQLVKDIQKLKDEVFGSQNEYVSFFGFKHFFGSPSLSKRIESLAYRVEKNEHRFELLLKHLGLEYHKITDENGSTQVKEVYKKIKKQPKGRRLFNRKSEDFEDED